MAIAGYKEVKQQLMGDKPSPLYFLYGEESYFIDDLAITAEAHVLNPGEEAFNKTVFYGRDTDAAQVVDQVRRFPMMAARQLVVLREAHSMSNFNALEPIFTQPVPTTVLIILYKKDRIDRRLNIFKTLQKNAVLFESKKMYENQVPVWINNYLKEKKLKLSPRAIQLLLEYLGTDLEKLVNAIDKLQISSNGSDVTDNMVENTIGISRSFNVFELQESFGQRDIPKILRIASVMEQDLKHNPLQLVVPSLFNYLSKLYMIKDLGNRTSEIKQVIRIRSDYIIKKYISAARKYTIRELEHMIHTLKVFDVKSKGVGVRDLSQEDLFRELILRLVHIK